MTRERPDPAFLDDDALTVPYAVVVDSLAFAAAQEAAERKAKQLKLDRRPSPKQTVTTTPAGD